MYTEQQYQAQDKVVESLKLREDSMKEQLEEQLIEFRTSILAKEKGLLIASKHWYNSTGLLIKDSSMYHKPSNDVRFPSSSAFSQSLLQKWLRDEHNIHILLYPSTTKWTYAIYKDLKPTPNAIVLNLHTTFEQALEEGLYQALQSIK